MSGFQGRPSRRLDEQARSAIGSANIASGSWARSAPGAVPTCRRHRAGWTPCGGSWTVLCRCRLSSACRLPAWTMCRLAAFRRTLSSRPCSAARCRLAESFRESSSRMLQRTGADELVEVAFRVSPLSSWHHPPHRGDARATRHRDAAAVPWLSDLVPLSPAGRSR